MSCSAGMALFLVLFALATFIFELFALFVLHALITRRDGRDLQAVDMAIMFLSMLLIALNGFAAVCPCFDADGNFSDLTTFWLPTFYGICTVLCKLITFDVFRYCVTDSSAAPSSALSHRTIRVYQSIVVATLFIVLLLTVCLGSLTGPTLALFIVSLSFLHCATVFVLIRTMKRIAAQQSAQGRSRVFSLSKSKSRAHGQNIDNDERDSGSMAANVLTNVQCDTAELLKLSRVLRSAVTSAVLFAVLALFAIWMSALIDPTTTVVALFFYAICTMGVLFDMVCVALLRTDSASPRQFCRDSKSANSAKGKASSSHWWVPQNKKLLGEDEMVDDLRWSSEQATPATFDNAADGGIINQQQPTKRGANAADGSELDKYTKPTLADPTSYTEAEKELDDLMRMELAKKSANSDDVVDGQS